LVNKYYSVDTFAIAVHQLLIQVLDQVPETEQGSPAFSSMQSQQHALRA
jgi:hypothetical protein